MPDGVQGRLRHGVRVFVGRGRKQLVLLAGQMLEGQRILLLGHRKHEGRGLGTGTLRHDHADVDPLHRQDLVRRVGLGSERVERVEEVVEHVGTGQPKPGQEDRVDKGRRLRHCLVGLIPVVRL